MTKVRLNHIVDITPESFKEETISVNGTEVKFPFIDIPFYPFDTQSRNGASYRATAGRESYGSFVGNSVLDNHNNQSLNDIIGQIHETKVGKWEDNGVEYEGVIGRLRLNPRKEDIIEDIKNGFINKGSIGVLVDNEKEDEDGRIECDVLEGLEFSLVPIPGFSQSQIQSAKAVFHEAYKTQPKKEGKPMPTKSEPFADFKDMDDCIAKNQDQDDPAAYCSAIKKKSEPENKDPPKGENMTDEKQSERLDKLETEFGTFKESLDALGSVVKEMNESLKAKAAEEKYKPDPKNVNQESVIAPAPPGAIGGEPEKPIWEDESRKQESKDRAQAITMVMYKPRRP